MYDEQPPPSCSVGRWGGWGAVAAFLIGWPFALQTGHIWELVQHWCCSECILESNKVDIIYPCGIQMPWKPTSYKPECFFYDLNSISSGPHETYEYHQRRIHSKCFFTVSNLFRRKIIYMIPVYIFNLLVASRRSRKLFNVKFHVKLCL